MSRSSLRCVVITVALLLVAAGSFAASNPAMVRADAMYRANQFAPAAAAYSEILAVDPGNALARLHLAGALYRGERFAEALDAWLQVTNIPGLEPLGYYHAACCHARLGNTDEAFQFLFAAQDAGFLGLTSIRADPDLAGLRDDPRFETLRDYPYESLALADGGSLEYVVRLPEALGAAGSHPVLIALSPGAGGRSAIEFGLRSLWGAQATSRGWIVICPETPAAGWDSEAGAAAFSRLLEVTAMRLPPEEGKFHLAGSGNGGDAAFRLALGAAGRLHGIVTAPGAPPEDSEETWAGLEGLYVEMFVGSEDEERLEASRNYRKRWSQSGIAVRLHELPGEHQLLTSLFAGALAETLDSHR